MGFTSFLLEGPAGDETFIHERSAFLLSFPLLSQVKERLTDRNIEM